MRSFRISGLTAKWGIGGGRSSIWDNNLIGRWDARTFPDGALVTIPNTATTAGKAPDLTVSGATMEKGTLQFDGVNDFAITDASMSIGRFTFFWDIDWLGKENNTAGIMYVNSLYARNQAGEGLLSCWIRQGGPFKTIPNTSVGIDSSGRYYSKSGAASNFTDTVDGDAPAGMLCIGSNSGRTEFTPMGFRQLLIFNKELSQDEVNDVLRVMFPA